MGYSGCHEGWGVKAIIDNDTSASILMVNSRVARVRQSTISWYWLVSRSHETSTSHGNTRSEQLWCSPTTVHTVLSAITTTKRVVIHSNHATTKASITAVATELEHIIYTRGCKSLGLDNHHSVEYLCAYTITKAVFNYRKIKLLRNVQFIELNDRDEYKSATAATQQDGLNKLAALYTILTAAATELGTSTYTASA